MACTAWRCRASQRPCCVFRIERKWKPLTTVLSTFGKLSSVNEPCTTRWPVTESQHRACWRAIRPGAMCHGLGFSLHMSLTSRSRRCPDRRVASLAPLRGGITPSREATSRDRSSRARNSAASCGSAFYCGLPTSPSLLRCRAILRRGRRRLTSSRQTTTPRGAFAPHGPSPRERLCRGGKIVAVLDVTNAMVGDPRCEIGRLEAYGLATDDFLGGYGVPPDAVDRDPVVALYAVDTTAMLALLARDELDDDDPEHAMARRTAELLRRVLA
jgi:hypothetical protein